MVITLTLEDEIDISRGDMIISSKAMYQMSDNIKATIVWMDEIPMKPYNSYIIKKGTSLVNARFNSKIYKHDINTFEKTDSDRLMLNDIATCTISLDAKIAINAYSTNRYTGSFIVIDRYTNNTVGAGMILEDTLKNKKVDSNKYSEAEKELNSYIRNNYPEWGCQKI